MIRATAFRPDESWALDRDAQDPLRGFRERFLLPPGKDGRPRAYLCGNSLGLQPRATAERLREELDDWARLAVDAHFHGRRPWYAYHEQFREGTARLVGAEPDEVVVMNGLTANLHLMLVSFFRPTGARRKILIEQAAFPSDGYAVRSQLSHHGLDPETDLIVAAPRQGEATLRTADLEALIERHAAELALILLPGVQYFTGQLLDIARLTARARALGCTVGWDLAHAVGNVPLQLHTWGCDFAVWCSYKYLNAGPGAVGGCFVHGRHAASFDLPRFAGWWGNDPATRFRMHLEPRFVPRAGADGWQLSNPPILALAPLLGALELFDQAGMERLRAKSLQLTASVEDWLDRVGDRRLQLLTPRDPAERGCQLSVQVPQRSRELFEALLAADVVGDFREPDVIRVAPAPLYNSFHDVWRFGQALEGWSRG